MTTTLFRTSFFRIDVHPLGLNPRPLQPCQTRFQLADARTEVYDFGCGFLTEAPPFHLKVPCRLVKVGNQLVRVGNLTFQPCLQVCEIVK